MLHIVHAVTRLSWWKGPMKPPFCGGRVPSGHTRSRLSPWPSAGARTPHMAHGARMSASAAVSETEKPTRCSAATRWYVRSRVI
eukprot:2939132-Pleurochrysis_carterae.AAC.2